MITVNTYNLTGVQNQKDSEEIIQQLIKLEGVKSADIKLEDEKTLTLELEKVVLLTEINKVLHKISDKFKAHNEQIQGHFQQVPQIEDEETEELHFNTSNTDNIESFEIKIDQAKLEAVRYKFSDYLPLLVVFCFIGLFTYLFSSLDFQIDIDTALRFFMTSWFLIFSLFKIINLAEFVNGFARYDLVAKKIKIYSYIYPFLELGLGLLYFFDYYPTETNLFTLLLMGVTSWGVLKSLVKKNVINCACLGSSLKLPLNYISLLENLIMALMALYMLLS
jgi:copper chaperone CopZ